MAKQTKPPTDNEHAALVAAADAKQQELHEVNEQRDALRVRAVELHRELDDLNAQVAASDRARKPADAPETQHVGMGG